MLNEYIRLYNEKEELFERWSAATDKLNEHQSKILQEFGLPNRFPYTQFLNRLIDIPNRERAFKELLVVLNNLGKAYSNQESRHDLQILRDAKQNLTEAVKVLPSLGIINSSYAEFIYQKIFLNGREDEKACLIMLKAANSYENLEDLLYFHQRIRTILKEIDILEIPYLTEFLRHDPEHNELINLFNPQFQIAGQEDEIKTYRSHLINTIEVFEDLGQRLFTSLVNVSMSGELLPVDSFEIGDVLNFKETDFRSLDDQNVKLIIKVLDAINQSSASMININNLDSNSYDSNELPF